MSAIEYEIVGEAVGFVVFAILDGKKLSLGEFASAVEMDILQVTNCMTKEGGFQAEAKDALAFFLFEDRAKSFVEAMK